MCPGTKGGGRYESFACWVMFTAAPGVKTGGGFNTINERHTMEYRTNETIKEEVERRLEELRRPGWEWVRCDPYQSKTMCAVMDFYNDNGARMRLSNGTVRKIDNWLVETMGSGHTLTYYNDEEAEDLDDVIAILEKFAADLP